MVAALEPLLKWLEEGNRLLNMIISIGFIVSSGVIFWYNAENTHTIPLGEGKYPYEVRFQLRTHIDPALRVDETLADDESHEGTFDISFQSLAYVKFRLTWADDNDIEADQFTLQVTGPANTSYNITPDGQVSSTSGVILIYCYMIDWNDIRLFVGEEDDLRADSDGQAVENALAILYGLNPYAHTAADFARVNGTGEYGFSVSLHTGTIPVLDESNSFSLQAELMYLYPEKVVRLADEEGNPAGYPGGGHGRL
jgi:hypothetical protein